MKKTTIAFLFTFIVIVFSSYCVKGQDDEKTQRIKASYILAFGQLPSAAEVNNWYPQSYSNSMAALMAQHKAFIKSGGYKKEAIINAYKDAYGLTLKETDGEYIAYSYYNWTYTDVMNNIVGWFKNHPADYEKVINNAFKYVYNRKPSTLEMDKWKNNSQKYSYAMMVGYLQTKKSK